MNDESCRFEPEIAVAARSGRWSDALHRHVAACAACHETAAVAGFMSRAAAALGRHEHAPDPTLIWLKAELARRAHRDRHERRLWIWSGAVSGVAATLTAWASIEWMLPVMRAHADAFAMTGGALALTLGVLYFAVYRPLANARR